MTAEERVLELVSNQNKPFSVQLATDFVAQYGIRKAQVQKALDNLADNGKIRMKEFGKTRIYLPLKDDAPMLSKEEKAAKQALAVSLKEECKIKADLLQKKESEVKGLQSSLSLTEVMAEKENMQDKINVLESKVNSLKETTATVTNEDRQQLQQELELFLSQWKKRKGIFNAVWGAIEEGLDRKSAEVFEEIGVDLDENCGVSVQEITRLLPKKRKF